MYPYQMQYTKGELEKFWIDSGFLLETLVGVHHLSHFNLPIILSPDIKCLSNYPPFALSISDGRVLIYNQRQQSSDIYFNSEGISISLPHIDLFETAGGVRCSTELVRACSLAHLSGGIFDMY
jgi:hypothetical protein